MKRAKAQSEEFGSVTPALRLGLMKYNLAQGFSPLLNTMPLLPFTEWSYVQLKHQLDK